MYILCHVMLEVCDLLSNFGFYKGLQVRRDFDLWTFNIVGTIIDYGTPEVE